MSQYIKKLTAGVAALLLAATAFSQGSQYYDHTTYPSQGAAGSSSAMRAELDLIEAGFGKLPTLAGNGGKITAVNAGGTAIEAITTTGTGSGVRATSPTLVTPALGTPSAAVLTNATGLPLTTGVTGTLPVANGGTGVTGSTGTGSVVLSSGPTLVAPVLGTPASGVATNLTGLPLTTGVTGQLPIANGGTSASTADGAKTALGILTPTSFRADNNDVNIATIADSTWTRIALSTERHDTNSEFASGTFTAKKAGPHRFYFQWSGAAPVANNAMRARLYKNGTEFAEGRLILVSGNQQVVSVYSEVDLAISDTIDTYVFHNRGTNQEVDGTKIVTYFTGGFIGAN